MHTGAGCSGRAGWGAGRWASERRREARERHAGARGQHERRTGRARGAAWRSLGLHGGESRERRGVPIEATSPLSAMPRGDVGREARCRGWGQQRTVEDESAAREHR